MDTLTKIPPYETGIDWLSATEVETDLFVSKDTYKSFKDGDRPTIDVTFTARIKFGSDFPDVRFDKKFTLELGDQAEAFLRHVHDLKRMVTKDLF